MNQLTEKVRSLTTEADKASTALVMEPAKLYERLSEAQGKVDSATKAMEASEKVLAELNSMIADVCPADASILEKGWLSIARAESRSAFLSTVETELA